MVRVPLRCSARAAVMVTALLPLCWVAQQNSGLTAPGTLPSEQAEKDRQELFGTASLHLSASSGIEVGADGNIVAWRGTVAAGGSATAMVAASEARLVGSGVTLQPDAANGREAVSFAGSGRLVVRNMTLFQSGALAAWIVFRAPAPPRYQFLLNWGVGSGDCKARKNMELGFDEGLKSTLMVHKGCRLSRHTVEPVPADVWQAALIEFPPTGTDGVTFERNGESMAAAGEWVQPGAYSTACADLDIGARNDGGKGKIDAFFSGSIAELALFPRPLSGDHRRHLWRHACRAFALACPGAGVAVVDGAPPAIAVASVTDAAGAAGPSDAAAAVGRAPGLVSPGIPMNDGVGGRPMPTLGFGTCCRPTAKGKPLVKSAVAYLRRGGRLLDTAFMYGNHKDIAAALNESGVSPEEVWITDKILPKQMGYEEAKKAVDLSLKELKVPSVDLMLIHVPDGGQEKRVQSWRALIEAQKAGKVRHIGVSNFNQSQIQELLDATGVLPANNQIEFNPFSPQPTKELVAWMQEKGITVTAYGSLGHSGANLTQAAAHAKMDALQRKHGKTAAQILLRWGVDRGVAVCPGATSEEHIADNLNILDFSLTQEELGGLEGISKPQKWKWYHAIPGK